MRILTLLLAFGPIFTQSCLGNGYITASAVPTPGMEGFSTYTVSVYGLGYAVNGVQVNFEGPLNQRNPLGLPSVFKDVFDGLTVDPPPPTAKQDSHFLFYSNEILALDTSESGEHLKGALTNLLSFNVGRTLDFAQLVIPDDESVSFQAHFDNGQGIDIPHHGVISKALVGSDPILSGGGTLRFDRTGGYDESRSAFLRLNNIGPSVDSVTVTGVSITGADASAFAPPEINASNSVLPTSIPERFGGRSFPVAFQPYDSVLRNYNAEMTLHTTAGDVLYQLVANQISPIAPKEIVELEVTPRSSNRDAKVAWEVSPTPGLPGYTTFTMTIESDQGSVTGIEMDATGPMNQVRAFDSPTPFTDLFEATGISGELDSHFLFPLADAVGFGRWKDEAERLSSGEVIGLAPLNPDGKLRTAQIVVKNGESVSFDGTFVITGFAGFDFRGSLNPPVVAIPEPATAMLLPLGAALGAQCWRRKRLRQRA
jgi:hypothetical protein